MKDRFSKTGVNAGILNSRQVFRMPPLSATKAMKPMYGNITRVIQTDASNTSDLALRPVAIR
ncbi:hypothetical protein D3C78_1918740 [compost metagenome]